MFSVWEPAQAWDFAPPGRWAMSTLSDTRARQYWDPHHLVSTQLEKDARPPQPAPECCHQRDMLWDVAAVYPPGAQWTDRMPPAIVFNGPIIDTTSAIESALLARR